MLGATWKPAELDPDADAGEVLGSLYIQMLDVGAPALSESLRVLADPAHERYDELRKWAPYFEPEEFDLSATDEAVRNPPEFWE